MMKHQMKGRPPLRWLRSFEATARHSSSTSTLAELHLTPLAANYLTTVQTTFTTLREGALRFKTFREWIPVQRTT